MSTDSASDTRQPVGQGKLIAFRIIAGVFGAIALALTAPFLVQSFTNAEDAVHRFHNIGAFVGFGLLFAVPLVLLAWRPRQTAVFRLALASGVATILAGLLGTDLISGSYFVAPILMVVLILLFPWRSELLVFDQPRPSGMVLAFVAAGPAAIYALHQSEIMRTGDPATDTTGHWAFHHWSGMAAAALTLALGAGVVALGGRARRTAAILIGAGAIVLGAFALALPDLPSALQGPWPILTIAWGAVYLVVEGVLDKVRTA